MLNKYLVESFSLFAATLQKLAFGMLDKETRVVFGDSYVKPVKSRKDELRSESKATFLNSRDIYLHNIYWHMQ